MWNNLTFSSWSSQKLKRLALYKNNSLSLNILQYLLISYELVNKIVLFYCFYRATQPQSWEEELVIRWGVLGTALVWKLQAIRSTPGETAEEGQFDEKVGESEWGGGSVCGVYTGYTPGLSPHSQSHGWANTRPAQSCTLQTGAF